jgi:hypothetical protein
MPQNDFGDQEAQQEQIHQEQIHQEQIHQEQIERLTQQFREHLKKALSPQPHTLDEIEKLAQQIGKQVKREVEKDLLESVGTGYEGSSAFCSCGKMARYVACYRRQLITLNGSQSLRRAYYYCQECRRGFCPLDQQIGIGTGQCSVNVRALLTRFASYLPFATAAKELEVVCGLRLSASTVRTQAQAIGRQLEAEWQQQEQSLRERKAAPSLIRPLQLHLSMDGVLIRVDKEWKEVKLASAYQTGKTGGVQRVGYCASLCGSSAFGSRMRALAHSEGAHNCAKTAFVADGGVWIWQEVGKYFPQSVQVLDFYHVTQHLWEVARARFGEAKKEQKQAAQAWIGQQKERLLNNQGSAVIADVGSWSTATEAHQQLQRRELGYLRGHEARMRYATFRQQGYHIASGVIEAGCKNVIQGRFKGVGMRWSAAGAQAMLPVRTAWCSSDPVDFAQVARRLALPS